MWVDPTDDTLLLMDRKTCSCDTPFSGPVVESSAKTEKGSTSITPHTSHENRFPSSIFIASQMLAILLIVEVMIPPPSAMLSNT